MVQTHLPGHLDSVRQKLRPKHQLLILKCYPRLPKNSAADVKPNGSELSYLLYYASTRRSKLHKVGSFLERKTASDVARYYSARVLVTLQILTALLESKAVGAGSGFALIAPYVLRIIRDLLHSTNDISLIEASLATWNIFCRDQDQATLKADHQYRELYEDVVRKYANFARKDAGKRLGKSTQVVAVQDAVRLREAGLGAMKSILLSDSLESESGRQLDIAIPAILSNMRGEDESYLAHLIRQSKQNEDDEKDKAIARRMSMATVRTYTNITEGSMEADPRQAEGTVQDADELAEEEAAVLALDCLRAVFSTKNRPQIRAAASAVLRYLEDLRFPRPTTRTSQRAPNLDFTTDTWATKLFETCTAWTPVQERFILIVTAVEMLVRLPLNESDLQQHLLYTDMVNHILRSDLNLIGLSIMDILLSLIQQILRVLQLSGPRVSGRSSAAQIFTSDEEFRHPASPTSTQPGNDLPSDARIRLTERLKHCIADLATHVYYTDQIADMLSAILMRLKPAPAPSGPQNPAVTAAAIEDPKAALAETASNISLSARDRSNSATSSYFSFDTARQIALEAARDMLLVANSSRSLATGGVTDSRNKVPIAVWEGTQWLLRDPTSGVRKAYVEALTTWLQLETNASDARVKEKKDKIQKAKEGGFARRAISNASQKKENKDKAAKSTFLQLLHLAVYDHALDSAMQTSSEGEMEILMLHSLLAVLVRKLGVNAIITGLPMILTLQDDGQAVEGGVEKVRIGSLVYGYLWSLAEVFDFDASRVGQEIFSEIRRRKDVGLWLNDMTVPPKPLDLVAAASTETTKIHDAAVDETALRPFEDRPALVDRIADSYAASIMSPPISAPASPGRSPGRRLSTTGPGLDRTPSSYLSAKQTPTASQQLPDKIKEALLENWSKESCLAAIAAVAPKSVSGSRSSPSHALAVGNHRQLLAAANSGPIPNNAVPKNLSQTPSHQQPYGSRLNSQSPNRRQSASTSGNGRVDSSAGNRGIVRVEDLKRVLAGGVFTSTTLGRLPTRRGGGAGGAGIVAGDDTASESLVDIEGEDLGSESGFATPPQTRSEVAVLRGVPSVLISKRRPISSSSRRDDEGAAGTAPVLSLPGDAVTNGRLPTVPAMPAVPNGAALADKPPPSRGGASVKSSKSTRRGYSRKELSALMAGIPSTGKEKEDEGGAFAGLGKPPY